VKLLITGVSGLVGSAVAEAAKRRGHGVTGIVHAWNGPVAHVDRLLRFDLRNFDRLTTELLEEFPDGIINCAALTEPAACEANPADARILNVELPRTLARISHHLSARLIQISTDLVFSGERAPYQPGAPLEPRSVYAHTKAAGEAAVLEAAPDFSIVLRVPLVNGNSPSGTRSLHERLFAAWAEGKVTTLFEDEIRQPALASDIAEVCVELCERLDIRGTHHWAGADALSRAEIGRRIARHFKIPSGLLAFTRAADDPRFADRPRNLALSCDTLVGKLRSVPRPFDDQLEALSVPRPARPWFHSLP
jgi:dTDP-4-dehydrorhamnose reductase